MSDEKKHNPRVIKKERMIPQLLTEEEVMAKFNISLGALRSMRSKPGPDPLPFYKVGRHVRYAVEDIMQWLDRRKVYDTIQAGRIA